MTMMFVHRPLKRRLPLPHCAAMIAHGRQKWREAMDWATTARLAGEPADTARALDQAAMWRGWTEESLRMRREAILCQPQRGAR